MSSVRSRYSILNGVGGLLTFMAIIIAVIALFPGKTLNKLFLFKVDTENLRIPAKLESSQFLGDLEVISGDNLIGDEYTRTNLGLAKSYTINILSYCSHYDDRTFCSKAHRDFWFDPVRVLRLETIGLADKLVDDLVHNIRRYERSGRFISIGLILFFLSMAIALVLSLFPSRHYWLKTAAATFASLGTAFMMAIATILTSVASRMVSGINNNLSQVGFKASRNSLIALPFTAAAFGLISSIMFATDAHRNRKGSAKRHTPVAVGHTVGPTPQSEGFGNPKGLLQRVTTWTQKGSYVRIDEQKSSDQGKQPLIPNNSAYLETHDEGHLNHGMSHSGRATPEYRDQPHQNKAHGPPSQVGNDIPLQPLGRSNNNTSSAYEPYGVI